MSRSKSHRALLAARAQSRALARPVNAAPEFAALADGPGGSEPAYGGGSQVLRWWNPGLRDAAGDTLRSLPSQRGRSRELARTNAIAAGAISTNVDRVVGTGLALVAQPNRLVLGWTEEQGLEWKRNVQNEFSMFADSSECDWAGEQNFYEKQRLVERGSLESGDVLSLLPDAPEATATMPYRLRIQTIEADRVGNPDGKGDTTEVAGGVKRKPGGGGSASFFVYDTHPGSLLTRGNRYAGSWYERVGPSGRQRILHHFRMLRPEQPRGIPYLSIIADLLKQLSRYTEAEVMAAVAGANILMTIESPAGTGAAPVFGATDAEVAVNPEIALAPGAVLGLAPGEKAGAYDPQRPNTAFAPFVLSIIQQIGIALGIPYELLIKQFASSYSASKAALLDAWMRFRAERVWLSRSFCQPVYETWLAEAVATGRIVAPGFFTNPLMRWAYTRAAWHGDSQGSINPKDEVEAYSAAVEARFMTRERAEWELFGTDWYETYDSKATEQRMLKKDDLLPVPKAGAPAPKPTGPSESDKAFASLAASVALMASREAKTPEFHMHAGDVNVTTPPVTVEGHDISVHLPEQTIQLEATVEAPQVHNQFVTPAAEVHVHERQQLPTKQTITRDLQSGEIASIVTEPINPTNQ